MQTIFGIFLGAVLTYFFNILVKRKEYKTIHEEQYVTKVCMPILKFLQKSTAINSQDIFNYIDEIFDDNLICIGKRDREMIDSLKRSSNKAGPELRAILQDFFRNSVDSYKKKIDSGSFMQHRNYAKIIKAFVIAIGMVGFFSFAIGIAGALGVYTWSFSLYNWRDSPIINIGLSFEGTLEVIRFIVIGLILIVVATFLYRKFVVCSQKKSIAI